MHAGREAYHCDSQADNHSEHEHGDDRHSFDQYCIYRFRVLLSRLCQFWEGLQRRGAESVLHQLCCELPIMRWGALHGCWGSSNYDANGADDSLVNDCSHDDERRHNVYWPPIYRFGVLLSGLCQFWEGLQHRGAESVLHQLCCELPIMRWGALHGCWRSSNYDANSADDSLVNDCSPDDERRHNVYWTRIYRFGVLLSGLCRFPEGLQHGEAESVLHQLCCELPIMRWGALHGWPPRHLPIMS